jgi:2-C-methyl-D-erythritol 4-phosphate cytidylyltransferase
MNIALIIAGGVGARMGMKIPKQFLKINGKPILVYTMEAFQYHPDIDAIEIVCLDGWQKVTQSYALDYKITKLENIVAGGTNGQESIKNGLYDIAKRHSDDVVVLIHDAIRPLVCFDIISENISICRKFGNAVTTIPCTAPMMKSNDSFLSEEKVSRKNLYVMQTPQTFFLKDIVAMHKMAHQRGIDNSICSADLYIDLGRQLYMCEGSNKNIKITTKEDLDIFKALLK